MNTKTSSWIIVVETALVILFAFLYFKTCNIPVTSDHKLEDSLKKVAKQTDSIFGYKIDSINDLLDSSMVAANDWESKYRAVKPQINAANGKVADLLLEVQRLKESGNIDSLNKAIADLQNSYLATVQIMNDLSNACDSTVLAKDRAFQLAKSEITEAGLQINDLKNQRDAALADDHSKDSVIDKLQAKKKANNIWAKMATVGLLIASAIAVFKH